MADTIQKCREGRVKNANKQKTIAAINSAGGPAERESLPKLFHLCGSDAEG